jgi:FtsZ-binding cell division protein ZapB
MRRSAQTQEYRQTVRQTDRVARENNKVSVKREGRTWQSKLY